MLSLASIYEESLRHQQRHSPIEMTASTLSVQEIYNQQGFLSALPVLNDAELREAKDAFSELEKKFGEYLGKQDEDGSTYSEPMCS